MADMSRAQRQKPEVNTQDVRRRTPFPSPLWGEGWVRGKEKRQAEIAVFQQLKAQFPEIHVGIGDRRRFLLVIAEQHQAKVAPNRPVTIAISLKQDIKVMFALNQRRQEPGNRGIDLIDNKLSDAFLTGAGGFGIGVMLRWTGYLPCPERFVWTNPVLSSTH